MYLEINRMEIVHINKDITISCVKATSFPDGVKHAHEKLRLKTGITDKDICYGISFPDPNHQIQYWAGVEDHVFLKGLPEGFESRVIPAGNYLSIIVKDFMAHMAEIEYVFRKMIADPRIDPTGACIEKYLPDGNLQCMVRLSE